MLNINCFSLQLWKGKIKILLILSFIFCPLVSTPKSAEAQIVPDNTLPTNSIVTPNGNQIEITGGTEAGNNLFHSFEQFSILTDNAAIFNNPVIIENIITRITGNSISNIDGLIRANGAANLFLINPNGIIFGPNGSLDIGGSFVGSTADSIQFADGTEFSAIDPQAPPLLTINVPFGLQYGANAGGITVQGSGNNLFLNSPQDPSVNRTGRPDGLQVNQGQTLALVGRNVALESGNLTAKGGRIELGSVNEGIVTVTPPTPTNSGWTLNYEAIENFQDISLSQAASVEVSSESGGGAISVQGRRVTVTDGSAMLSRYSRRWFWRNFKY